MSVYHNILGVPANAGKDDIKKAYRKLCMVHHPDKGGNPNKFLKIKEAYEALSVFDPNKTHNIHHEEIVYSADLLRKEYIPFTGSLDYMYILNGISLAYIQFKGEVLESWILSDCNFKSFIISKKTLIKCNYSFTITFVTKNATIIEHSYSYKDPRNKITKFWDHLNYLFFDF